MIIRECTHNKRQGNKDSGQSAPVAALTNEEAIAYSASYYRELERESAIRFAVNKAEIKAEAKGRAEGEAKGRAEGEAKGTHQMLQQNVHSMRANGLDNPTIARFLNQPLDIIESL